MSELKEIPSDKLHDIAMLIVSKKDYNENDIESLTSQIKEDYLKAYNSLKPKSHSWGGVAN